MYNLMIMGHGRHGKDTAADYITEKLGLKTIPSSLYAAKTFIFDELKDLYGYKDYTQCYELRHKTPELRGIWYRLIKAYNGDDLARVSREIFADYDIYVGIRNIDEWKAAKLEGLIDVSIWIDASERLPLEPSNSITVSKECADIIIDNNGTEEEFMVALDKLIAHLKIRLNVDNADQKPDKLIRY